jgi:hypothetical protein
MSQETFTSLPGHSEKGENFHGSEINRVQSETSTLLDPHDPLNVSPEVFGLNKLNELTKAVVLVVMAQKASCLGCNMLHDFHDRFFVRLRGMKRTHISSTKCLTKRVS